MEKRPIISVLRAMLPGDKEVFPIEQSNSVSITYCRRMTKERLEGWKFSCENDYTKGVTKITRIK